MISSEPANSADRAQEFVLYGIDQGDRHLVGTWSYTNGAVGNKTPPRVVIEGTRTTDGVFWPDVKLEARKGRTGKWKQVPNPAIEGELATVIIEPNAINFDLTVNLDAFKPLMGTYESGRIVLKTGRTLQFELKDLVPPEQDTKKARSEAVKAYAKDPDVGNPEKARYRKQTLDASNLIPIRTLALVSSATKPRLGSSIDDFRSLWGPPSNEESLVRTANLKWNRHPGKAESMVPGVFAIEVAFLDGIACEIALRSKQQITPNKLVQLAKPFLTAFRHADFAKPKSDSNGFLIYELSDGTFVSVNKHAGHRVIVITGPSYIRNQDVFDGEAAKVRLPTSNH